MASAKATTLSPFNLCPESITPAAADLSEKASILCMNECGSPPFGVLLIKKKVGEEVYVHLRVHTIKLISQEKTLSQLTTLN